MNKYFDKRIINISEKKKKRKIYTVLVLLLCSCFFIACSLFYKKNDYQQIAIAIGKEQIGASIPDIIYADNNKCIFYDYHGVFIYEFNSRKISDYIEFSEIGFSCNTQGDNATYAFSGNAGKSVYITNYNELYLYDCEEEKGELCDYSTTKMPRDDLDSMQVSDEQDNNAISQSYILSDGTRLYWKYNGNDGRYSELQLICTKNGNIEEYAIFN